MSITIPIAAALLLLVGLAFFLLFRRLIAPVERPDLNPEWWTDFSAEKYRPMERLFSEQDYEFLAAQPGFEPEVANRLRSERRRIFRQYLRSLSRDFGRLYATAKLLLLHSAQDRPDLAKTLLKQRLTFQYALAVVRCRLVLQPLGLKPVDVRGLVRALEAMCNELRALAAAMEPSASVT